MTKENIRIVRSWKLEKIGIDEPFSHCNNCYIDFHWSVYYCPSCGKTTKGICNYIWEEVEK